MELQRVEKQLNEVNQTLKIAFEELESEPGWENDVNGKKIVEEYMEQNQDIKKLLKKDLFFQQLQAIPGWEVVEFSSSQQQGRYFQSKKINFCTVYFVFVCIFKVKAQKGELLFSLFCSVYLLCIFSSKWNRRLRLESCE